MCVDVCFFCVVGLGLYFGCVLCVVVGWVDVLLFVVMLVE